MQIVRLGEEDSLIIGDGYPCAVVAEISCNHKQDKQVAIDLIFEAAKAGADAVKFQAYTPDTITLDTSNMEEEQKKNFIIKGNIWEGKTFYDLYKEAYTPWEWFKDLKLECLKHNLKFIVSVFDESSVDFLEQIGVDAYKIASFEINHAPLLKKVASTDKPIILSTGVATGKELQEAVNYIYEGTIEKRRQVIILKCTSLYPCPISELDLNMISYLKNKYDLPVGLSDHTQGVLASTYAVAAGANMIEKHFTISKDTFDGKFSLESLSFNLMIQKIRECESAMGKSFHYLSEEVAKARLSMRSIFACKNIKKGEKFTKDNIRIVRPNLGIRPCFYDMVIDDGLQMVAKCDIKNGQPLALNMIGMQTYD